MERPLNRYDVGGRAFVVTGGAGGIGRAIARAALAGGACVSLWDADAAALASAATDLAQPARVATRHVDVTDEASIAAALAADVAQFARIDAFVNNAGILGEVAPLWETTPADFRRVMEVNLIGAYLCLRAVLDLMRKQALQPLRGHVVNVASIQGKEGMPRAGAYSASKAALIALTKTAGKEAGPLGVMVNCITPAAAETAMARALTPERRSEILGRIPLGRFVNVDEIAHLVLFLCSDDCAFSTGAVFDLSGGRATY
ncbi:MAG: SDR family oxidoreductase [Casimicrobiaceae bacterium]